MRILWVAVADGRGHLMRAHLAKQLLAPYADVDIATTSADGLSFLTALGTYEAKLLNNAYKIEYDSRQNLYFRTSKSKILRFLLNPNRCLRHWLYFRRLTRKYDLTVNDSFYLPLLLPGHWKLVNCYGEHTLSSIQDYLPPWANRLLLWRLKASFGQIVHSVRASRPESMLPPLIAKPRPLARLSSKPLAVVYLNPAFSSDYLARDLHKILHRKGFKVHAVGENITGHGFKRYESRLGDYIAAANVVVSTPGAGILSQVLAYKKPFVAILANQPEQRKNLQGAELPSVTVVDVNRSLEDQLESLPEECSQNISEVAIEIAEDIREQWLDKILDLAK